ncbi:MAG: hypothetical protein U0361_22670 [Nitrospiraceae bacterium]
MTSWFPAGGLLNRYTPRSSVCVRNVPSETGILERFLVARREDLASHNTNGIGYRRLLRVQSKWTLV